jgi:protein-tyrosine phosphatase
MLRTEDVAPDVLPNLRDVGGLPTEDGRRTRAGVLLRSAAPKADDRDPEDVAWPPAEVVDLRSLSELKGRPHPLSRPGTRVHALPFLSGGRSYADDFSDMPDLAEVYPDFLHTGAQKLLTVLRLAAHADGPVLVHCAAGKDRTGITVAVLLRAAGVTREAVIADYVETAQNIDAVLARDMTHGPEDPTHLQRLMGAPPEAITVILDELDAAAEGAEDAAGAWLLRAGATPEDLADWRSRILAA